MTGSFKIKCPVDKDGTKCNIWELCSVVGWITTTISENKEEEFRKKLDELMSLYSN